MLTRCIAAVATTLLFASAGSAQRQVVRSRTGPLFRYNGDTIWTERDSTINRTVYRGDTVFRTTWVNDVITFTSTYVVMGENAQMVEARNGRGEPAEDLRTIPNRLATSDRDMLQSAIRSLNMPRPLNSNTDVVRAPAQPITYVLSYGTSIVQHLDTVAYVRGCLGRGKLDTTTFVYRGDTAVERLVPRRLFGEGMAYSLTTAMFNANVQRSLASRNPGATNLPTTPNDCSAAIPASLKGDRSMYNVGTVTRFHNDTIWRERDSTVWREVYKADTVERSFTINGTEKTQGTFAKYVLRGDSALTLDLVNLDGTRRTESIGRYTSTFMILTERRMMEQQFASADRPLGGGTAVSDGLSNPVPRPDKTGAPVTYDPSPEIRLVQLGDTVRFIRGCPTKTKVDTTLFVFFGADSVKRLNPARMFGRGMVASLVSQMYMTGVRQSIASRDVPPSQPLPRAPDLAQQCVRQ